MRMVAAFSRYFVISQFCWVLWETPHLHLPFSQHPHKAVYLISTYHEVTRPGVVQEALPSSV